MTRGEKIILVCIVIPIAAYWAAARAHLIYYIPHVEVTQVRSVEGAWPAGEYRTCFSLNEKTAERAPELACAQANDSGMVKQPNVPETSEVETVRVRFYGRTFDDIADGQQTAFFWRCKRNDSKNPSITCDHRRLVEFKNGSTTEP